MPRDLKIGISCYPSPGGSGVVATELGLALAARGHEVHFIVSQAPVRLRQVRENLFTHKVETVSYPLFDELPYSLSLAAQMAKVARTFELDLMHVHYAIPHAVSAYLARQMMSPLKLPTMTTLHGTDITLVGMHPSLYDITRFSIDRSHCVTAVSAYLRRRTEEIFQPRREVVVVPNFVDTDRFAPAQRRCGGEEPVVMHASNFRPVKRVETVVRVFQGISRRVPAHLLMVGDGPERERAESLTHELGLSRRVHFLGNQASMEELLPQAQLFLLPSEFESFGLVALEAMSAGVPVIVTREGGAGELVNHGRGGFLFHPHDVGGMVEAGINLLRDEELHRRVARAARETAVQRFDQDRIVPRYVELYQRMRDGPPPPMP